MQQPKRRRVSQRELLNTGSGKYTTADHKFKPFGEDIGPSTGVKIDKPDFEFMGAAGEDEVSRLGDEASLGQTGGSKLGRSIGRGVASGASGATLGFMGNVLGMFNDEAGNALRDLDENFSEYMKEVSPVHETPLGEEASFSDQLFRFSTLESIVDSAVEFGSTGIFVGGASGMIGRMAMKLGGTSDIILGSRLAAKAVEKATGGIGRVLHGADGAGKTILQMGRHKLKSKALIDGLANNYLEGMVMANELEKDMMYDNAPILYNPDVADSDKKRVYDEIQSSKNKLKFANTFLAASDILGFSTIFSHKALKAETISYWGYLKKNMHVLSASEGAEEWVQSLIQAESQYQGAKNLSERFDGGKNLEGFNYQDPDDPKSATQQTLLWQTNPEKARTQAVNEVLSVADRLIAHGTTAQAGIEAISGIVGGGPQFIITGLPGMRSAVRSNNAQVAAQQEGLKEINKVYEKFLGKNIANDADLNAMVDELSKEHVGTDRAQLVEVVEDYAVEKAVLDALGKGYAKGLEDQTRDSRAQLKRDLKDGSIDKEDFDKYNKRLSKVLKTIAKYENYRGYANYTEISANLLKEASLNAALASLNVELKANGVEVETRGKLDADAFFGIDKNIEEDEFEEITDEEIAAINKDTAVPDEREVVSTDTNEIVEKTVPVTKPDGEVSDEATTVTQPETTAPIKLARNKAQVERLLTQVRNQATDVNNELNEVRGWSKKGEDRKAELREKKTKLSEAYIRLEKELTALKPSKKPKKVSEDLTALQIKKTDFLDQLKKNKKERRTLMGADAQVESKRRIQEDITYIKLEDKINGSNNNVALNGLEKKINQMLANDKTTEYVKTKYSSLLATIAARREAIKNRTDVTTSKRTTKSEKKGFFNRLADKVKKKKDAVPLDQQVGYDVNPDTEDTESASSKAENVGTSFNLPGETDAEKKAYINSLTDAEARAKFEEVKGTERTARLADKYFKNFLHQSLVDVNALNNAGFDKDNDIYKQAVADLANDEVLGGAMDVIAENRGPLNDESIPVPGNSEEDIQVDKAKVIAMAKVAEVAAGIARAKDGKLPSRGAMKNIMALAGFNDQVHQEVVDSYYDTFSDEREITTSNRTLNDKPDHDKRHKFHSREERTWMPTSATFKEAFNSISWIEDAIKDWEVVRKGLGLNIKVLSNKEIAQREIEYEERGTAGRFLVYIGTSEENIEEYTWDEYLKGIKSGKIDSDLYPEALMRPIEVRIAAGDGPNSGKLLGHLRNAQWGLRDRKDISEQEKLIELGKLDKLRTSLMKGNKNHKKVFNWKVAEREGNISKGKNWTNGTALRQGTRPLSAGSVFKGDEEVIFTTLNHNSRTTGIDNLLNEQIEKEGKEVILPQYLKDDLEENSGALLVLIPVENTKYYVISKMATQRLTDDDFQVVSDIITNLDSFRVKEMLRTANTPRNGIRYVPKGSIIRNMIKSILYTTENLDKLTTPDTFKYDIQVNDTDDHMSLKDKPVGASVESGTIIFKVKIGDSLVELPYTRVVTNKTGKNGRYRDFSYRADFKDTLRKQVIQNFDSAVTATSRENIPYYNIRENSIRYKVDDGVNKVYKKGDSRMMRATRIDGKLTMMWNKPDYVQDYIMRVAQTFIEKPSENKSGKKNYFTNTLITVEPDANTTVETKEIVEKPAETAVTTAEMDIVSKMLELEAQREEIAVEVETVDFYSSLVDSIKKKGKYSINNEEDADTKAALKDLKANGLSMEGMRTLPKNSTWPTILQWLIAANKMLKARDKSTQDLMSAQEKAYDNLGTSTENRESLGITVLNLQRPKGLQALMDKRKAELKAKTKAEVEIVETPKIEENIPVSALIAKMQAKLKAKKSEELKTKTEDEISTQEKADANKESKKELENPVTEVPKPKKPLSTVSKLMKQFQFKTKLNLNIDDLGDMLSIGEVGQITDMTLANFMDSFLSLGIESVQSSYLGELRKQTYLGLAKTFKNLQDNLPALEKELVTNIDKKKFKQYKQTIGLIVDTFYDPEKNLENTEFMRTFVQGGIGKALQNLGYKISGSYNSVLKQVDSQEKKTTNKEDKYIDDPELATWGQRFANIAKDPKDKASARLRAKVAAFYAYEYNDDTEQVDVHKNVFDSPALADETYLHMLNLFSKLDSNSLASKLAALQELKTEILSKPRRNASIYFMVDVFNALTQQSGKHDFTFKDRAQFNMAMNNDMLEVKGLIMGKNRLQLKDYNFASIYDATISRVNLKLKSLIEDEEAVGVVKEILGYRPKTRALYKISAGKTGRFLDDIKKLVVKMSDSKWYGSLTFEEKASLLMDIQKMHAKTVKSAKGGKVRFIKGKKVTPTKSKVTELNKIYIDAIPQIQTLIRAVEETLAPDLLFKTIQSLEMLGVPVDATGVEVLRSALMGEEEIPKISYRGDKLDYGYNAGQTIDYLINDIKQAADSKTNAKDLELSWESKSLVAHVIGASTSKMNKTTIRIGNKLIGTFNDKIYLYQMIKKLRNPDGVMLKSMDKDIYSHASTVKYIMQNKDQFPDLDTDLLWDSPVRAGLLPTPTSNIDEADDSFNFMMYDLGNYLVESEVANIAKSRSDITIPKGDKKHTLKARINKFITPVHSDKDAPFAINSLDFSVHTRGMDGDLNLSTAAVEYYMDEVVLPDLNMIQNGQADLFTAVPGLNNNEMMHLIDRLPKDTVRQSLFDFTGLNDDQKADLRKFQTEAKKAVREQLYKSTGDVFRQLIELGFIKEIGENSFAFTSHKQRERNIASMADFAAYNSTEAELAAQVIKEKEVADEASELGIAQSEIYKDVDEIKQAYGSFINNLLTGGAIMRMGYKGNEFVSDKFNKKVQAILAKYPSRKEEKQPSIETQKGMTRDYKALIRELGWMDGTKAWKELDTLADLRKYFADIDESSKILSSISTTSFKLDYLSPAGLEVLTKLTNTKNVTIKTIGGKTEKSTPIYMERFMEMLMNKEFSTQISNSNYKQLIGGHTSKTAIVSIINREETLGQGKYNYKADIGATYDGEGKRSAKQVTPFRPGDGEGTQINVIWKDTKEDSDWYNGEDGFDKITNIDISDAQSWTTIESRLIYNVKEGIISPAEARLAKRYWSGELSKWEMIKKVGGMKFYSKYAMTIDKPRTVGFTTKTLPNGFQVREDIYQKTGEAVLTEHNTPDDKDNPKRLMFEYMKALQKAYPGKQIRIFTGEAAKLRPDVMMMRPELVLFDLMGQVDINAMQEKYKRTEFEVDNDWHGRQVVTAYKEGKKNKPSGQVENLIFATLKKGQRLKDIFNLASESDGKLDIFNEWESTISAINEIKLKKATAIIQGVIDEVGEGGDALSDMLDEAEQNAIAELQARALAEAQGEAVEEKPRISKDEILSRVLTNVLTNLREDDITYSEPLLLKWLELERTPDPDNEGEFLNTFKYNVTRSTYLLDYADAIRKTIEKNTVAKKEIGDQLALESDLGWDLREAGKKKNGLILFDNARVDLKTGRLMPQTVGKPAQILIPYNIKMDNGQLVPMELFMKDGVDELGFPTGQKVIDHTKLPSEVLEKIGYRTPTQSENMISYVEVVGFLPAGMEATAVSPKEFVALMGSDFDIDKLNLYGQYYKGDYVERTIKYRNKTTGEIVERTKRSLVGILPITKNDTLSSTSMREKWLQNRKVQLMQTILSDTTILKEEVAKVLEGEKHLIDTAVRMSKLIQPINRIDGSFSNLSSSYNHQKRNNAAGASVIIGIFAKNARVSAMLQREPIKFYSRDKDTKLLGEISLKLGEGTFSQFGGERNKVWAETSKTDQDYDKRKNNFSAAITLAVDNENIQMLDKLGLTRDQSSDAAMLMLAGFRLKTAIAMVNMPRTDNSDIVKTYASELVGDLNKANNTKLKVKDITPEMFSLVSQGTDETELAANINSLNERMRKRFDMLGTSYTQEEKDAIGPLTQQDIVNILAHKSFYTSMRVVGKVSISPISWTFNMDSQGFERNFGVANRNWKRSTDLTYEPLFAPLRRLPEIKGYLDAFDLHMRTMSSLFLQDRHIKEVHDLLGESGLSVNATYEISQAVRYNLYKHHAPNRNSLINRLNAVLYSKKPHIIEYVRGNDFLKRLDVRGNDIVFLKDEEATPGDIQRAFEDLETAGEQLAGIDTAMLFEDLIKYALTTKQSKYGNSYIRFISPEYYKYLAVDESNVPYNKIAAFVAYKNMFAMHEGTQTAQATVWRTKGDFEYTTKSGTTAIYTETFIKYLADTDQYDANGNLVPKGTPINFREEDAKAFSVNPVQNYARTQLITPKYEADTIANQEGETVEADIDKTLERIMSTSALVPFKKYFSALFGNRDLSLFITGSSISFNEAKKTVNVAGNSMNALRHNIIHEGTHAGIQRAILAWKNGTLDSIIGNPKLRVELVKIFVKLDAARKDIMEDIIQQVSNDRNKANKTETLDMSVFNTAMAYDIHGIFADVNPDGTPVMSLEEMVAVLPADVQRHLKEVSALNFMSEEEIASKSMEEQYDLSKTKGGESYISYVRNMMAIHIFSNKQYEVDSSRKDGHIYISALLKGKKPKMMLADPDRVLLYEEFAKNYKKQYEEKLKENPKYTPSEMMMDSAREMNAIEVNAKDNEMNTIQQYIYGSSNINELAAQSYTYGTSTPLANTRFSDYNITGKYNSVIGQPLKGKANSLINKVFQLLRDIVAKIVGYKNANSIFTDVVYAGVITNSDMFVLGSKNKKITKTTYTDIAEDIIQNCK